MAEKTVEKKAGARDFVGNQPELKEGTLEPSNRVIADVEDAISVTENLIKDAKILIKNASRITRKKQGGRPYIDSILKEQGRSWMPNISSGAFGTELRKAAPRLYMPILTASTLTAASLPTGWPDGEDKSNFFREEVTNTIRSWKKQGMFVRGLAKEVVDYGFAFAVWTDPYQWEPHLVRMDKGFVPRGTEIMDDNIPMFMLEWEYKPDELIALVKNATGAGVESWEKDSVAYAITKADVPVPEDREFKGVRKWEELIKEQVSDYSYTKGFRVIKCRHLFVTKATGKVSHYILWPEGPGGSGEDDHRLLFEHLDAYDNMSDVVVPLVFDFGDGTIHGSWGAGQMLYDVADMLDRARCDMIANLKLTNKVRMQVKEGGRAEDAKLIVNSDMVIAAGGDFAQNVGGMGTSTDSFIALDAEMQKWMQERIGAYLPPIPLANNDIKAAQVNAVQQQNQEIQRDVLEIWLMQYAYVIATMTKRLLDDGNPDLTAKSLRQKLLGQKEWYKTLFEKIKKTVKTILGVNTANTPTLTEDEMNILVNQPAVQSVADFTQFAASQRAQFAAAIKGDARFDQVKAATLWAQGVPSGGARLARYLVIPGADQTQTIIATQKQIMEDSALIGGRDVPVSPTDNHWIHMQEMKPGLESVTKAGAVKVAAPALRHYAAHYAAGVAQKVIPPDKVNEEKAYIAGLEKALAVAQQQEQMKQIQAAGAAQTATLAAAGGGVPPGIGPGATSAVPPGVGPGVP